MMNLTASIELKDKIIDDLTEKFQKSMESNEKLRSKLFSNDLDREFRLAKLGKLTIKIATQLTHLKRRRKYEAVSSNGILPKFNIKLRFLSRNSFSAE